MAVDPTHPDGLPSWVDEGHRLPRAFTTFSTFSYEAHTLLRTDRVGAALTYVALSVLGGLAAAAAGYATVRSLA